MCLASKSFLIVLLVQATRAGSFAKMQVLVEKGADVNAKVVGCTALMYAAFYGRDEMVSYLLENGASVDAQNLNGITALHWAVEKNQYSTIELLLKAGANANLPDTSGCTGMWLLALFCNLCDRTTDLRCCLFEPLHSSFFHTHTIATVSTLFILTRALTLIPCLTFFFFLRGPQLFTKRPKPGT